MKWPAKIVLLGAGKVATALGQRLTAAGYAIQWIWSRTDEAADSLAQKVNSKATTSIREIAGDANLYIIAVPDQAIPEVAKSLSDVVDEQNSLIVHTSGATPATVLAPFFHRYGVLYPLQSFSPGRIVDFTQVPLCLYTAKEEDFIPLEQLAQALSQKVYRVSDEQRLQLHLAAVFVNNFTNYLQFIGQSIVEEHELPGELLLPLVQETIHKLQVLSPADAQTGPALRYDQSTINRHLELLQNHPAWQHLYELLSQGIQKDLT